MISSFSTSCPLNLVAIPSHKGIFYKLQHIHFFKYPFCSVVSWCSLNIREKTIVIYGEYLTILSLQELKKWMDDSKDGFIYFTFGSMVMIETFPRKILDIFYKSLAKIAPVRILMKIPKPEKLPPGLPENIRISSWISQLKILSESHRPYSIHYIM